MQTQNPGIMALDKASMEPRPARLNFPLEHKFSKSEVSLVRLNRFPQFSDFAGARDYRGPVNRALCRCHDLQLDFDHRRNTGGSFTG